MRTMGIEALAGSHAPAPRHEAGRGETKCIPHLLRSVAINRADHALAWRFSNTRDIQKPTGQRLQQVLRDLLSRVERQRSPLMCQHHAAGEKAFVDHSDKRNRDR
jgi:hypothetical protein